MTRILHLSDIHLNNPETAETWRSQLEADLRNELRVDRLDCLVISGDVADKSTPDEYAAANLIAGIMDRFDIKKDRVVIVARNHDLNWQLSKRGYRFEYRDELGQKPVEGRHIPMGDDGVLIRNEKSYGKRFSHFGDFYSGLTGKAYPEEHNRQGMVYEFPDDGLIFLGLNSAWEIELYADHSSSGASFDITMCRRLSDPMLIGSPAISSSISFSMPFKTSGFFFG